MFENLKETVSEAYNDLVINMYDSQNFESATHADNVYNFSENKILLSDCWYDAKGNLWCSWNSDARLKENISDFSLENTNWLNDIRLRKYNYIGQNKEKIGVLAQELEKILPNAAETQKNGYMTIDLSQLLFLTIASLKEIKDDINKLQKENCYLTQELNSFLQKEKN